MLRTSTTKVMYRKYIKLASDTGFYNRCCAYKENSHNKKHLYFVCQFLKEWDGISFSHS